LFRPVSGLVQEDAEAITNSGIILIFSSVPSLAVAMVWWLCKRREGQSEFCLNNQEEISAAFARPLQYHLSTGYSKEDLICLTSDTLVNRDALLDIGAFRIRKFVLVAT
jgi:hypothetical protein